MLVKSLLLSATAIAAAYAGLSPASAQEAAAGATSMTSTGGGGHAYSGYFEFYTGISSIDGLGSSFDGADPYQIGAAARVYLPAWDKTGFQLDFFGEGGGDYTSSSSSYVLDIGDGITEGEFTSWGGAVHFNYREPSHYLFGAVFGLWNNDIIFGDFASDIPGNTEETYYIFAAEGQYYTEEWTFYAQVGRIDTTNGNDSGYSCTAACGAGSSDFGNYLHDVSFVRGQARFFPEPNLRIMGEVMLANGNASFGTDADVNSYSLEVAKRFDENPLTIYAAYTFASQDMNFSDGPSSYSGSYDTQQLVVGARMAWGQETSISEDRDGASLDTPDIQRLIATSGEFGFFLPR
jgi:hypothetical protein